MTFNIENILFLHYKTRHLNEEANCTEPSNSVRVPFLAPPMLSSLFDQMKADQD